MLRYVTVYAEPRGILRPSVIGITGLQQVSGRAKCQTVGRDESQDFRVGN
jgi:hypothetical protein